MTSAELVWKDGLGKVLPAAALRALLAGLESDDPLLIQGATSSPLPLQCVADYPLAAGDAIVYAGWKGGCLPTNTVGDGEEFFATACYGADKAMGEPAACRWFLNFWDDTPRVVAVELLTQWVRNSLADHARGIPEPSSN